MSEARDARRVARREIGPEGLPWPTVRHYYFGPQDALLARLIAAYVIWRAWRTANWRRQFKRAVRRVYRVSVRYRLEGTEAWAEWKPA